MALGLKKIKDTNNIKPKKPQLIISVRVYKTWYSERVYNLENIGNKKKVNNYI